VLTKIARLGDRMLLRMVPAMKAHAVSSTCVRIPRYDSTCNSYMMAYLCASDGTIYIACKYS
jgi:hypothetical protein